MGLPEDTDIGNLTESDFHIFLEKIIAVDRPIAIESEISGPLRSIYERDYDIWDVKRHNPIIKRCAYCGKTLAYDNTPTLKYCNRQCRLSAYYERRNKAQGNQKSVDTHTHCLVCGKSLEGKRAGTKTCSISCRKSLSMRKKVISFPALP